MFKKPVLPEVERVKLKPYKGIRPAYYILFTYFIIALVLFFILCLLPGLVSNKAYVSFSSDLPLYGVYEDGVYLGNGHDSVFETTSGNHSYTFTLEGIEIGKEEVKIPRYYFFTLFAHKKTVISPSFTYTDELENKVTEAFLKDVALYSAITDYSSSYPFPPLFSSYAKEVIAFKEKDISQELLYGALHITSQYMYSDYLVALSYLENSSINYESNELDTINSYLDNLYTKGNIETLKKNDKTTEIKVSKLNDSFYHYSEGTITLGEETLSSYPEINKAPISTSYSSFEIGSNLITENEYAAFVEENPKWALDNKEVLIKEGLVDSNYLSGITLSTKSMRPIRSISYYCALEYCKWKSEKDGVLYSLPTLEEWTVAALSSNDKKYVTSLVYVENNSSTPTGLLGQLWEYTSTPYIPLSRLIDQEKVESLSQLYDYDDIIVMGGSYAQSDISSSDIGVMGKASCSEFCGFRLVKHE